MTMREEQILCVLHNGIDDNAGLLRDVIDDNDNNDNEGGTDPWGPA